MEHRAEIDIDVPVKVAYNQWTQFEDFPLFMNHVESIEQIDDTHIRWNVKIWGITRTWVAEITEQSPDQRVAWTSTDGTKNRGVVTFHALDDEKTRVVLQIEVDPEGFVETIGDFGGFVSDRTKKDLDDFKEFIESRGKATGAWRGEVVRPENRREAKLREQLECLSKDELVDHASTRDIDNRSNMSKNELIDELMN